MATAVAFVVRRSLKRAVWEAGGDDAPHRMKRSPVSLSLLTTSVRWASPTPCPSFGEAPGSFTARFASAQSSLGECGDATGVIHRQREIKSAWEIEQMDIGASVQCGCSAVQAVGGEGMSELTWWLQPRPSAEAKACGVQMRRYPLQCDRGVIVASAGGIPSFFDSAVGGTGPHPLSGMGSGFNLQDRRPRAG